MGNENGSELQNLVNIVQDPNVQSRLANAMGIEPDEIKEAATQAASVFTPETVAVENNEVKQAITQAASIQNELSTATDQMQNIGDTIKRIEAATRHTPIFTPCDHRTDCTNVQYLVDILKKYHKSNISHNKDSQEKPARCNRFTEVNISCCDTLNVTHLLNAYQHILYQHSAEFENIHNLLNENIYGNGSCDLLQCLSFRRNHRERFKLVPKGGLKELYGGNVVQQQFLDMIHCYFMHSFDTGMRLKAKPVCDEKKNDIRLGQDIDTIRAKRKIYENMLDEKESDQCSTGAKFISEEYSIGVRYYYWDFYKNKNELFDPAASIPIKQHSREETEQTLGYWYIGPQYESLKDEMMNNKTCGISESQWTNTVNLVQQLMQSVTASTMKCFRKQSAKCYDDMKEGDPISEYHLIAAKLYTDFDELQRQFSKTFRKLDTNETNQQLKSRHSQYHFLGKYLREYVECFGMEAANMTLWHGIQKQCSFSSIQPYFKGPFSTSQEYDVAVGFSSFTGIILKLKIDKNAHRMGVEVDRMCCIDCAWLSRYPNEREILFLGGINRHMFQTIIHVSTGDNDGLYIQGIRQMSYCMTNWNVPLDMLHPDRPKKPTEKWIVKKLMKHEFHTCEPNHELSVEFKDCPEYITELLHSHCTNVRAIAFGDELYPDCHEQNLIFTEFFQLENKWIHLQRLTTVFPKLDLIFFQFENASQISNSLEITFDFLRSNETKMRMILAKVEKNNQIKEEINEFRNTAAFDAMSNDWNLRVRDIDDKFIKDFAKEIGIDIGESQMLFGTVKLIDDSTKLLGQIFDIPKHSVAGKIQDFTNKHRKLMEGVIVEIKRKE